jgi:Skp family chaperone for outer membrane proteins
MLVLLAMVLAGPLVMPRPLVAQDGLPALELGSIQSPVLIIDVERVFAATLYGQRVNAELAAQAEALAAENRRIEADLTAEEQDLTRRRATLAPEVFRAEAQAFDEKVQGIRDAQDAKERALNEALAQAQDAFLQAATPVLGQLMQQSGAVVILDRRTVFLATGAIDITDEAIAAIDAGLGDGAP